MQCETYARIDTWCMSVKHLETQAELQMMREWIPLLLQDFSYCVVVGRWLLFPPVRILRYPLSHKRKYFWREACTQNKDKGK